MRGKILFSLFLFLHFLPLTAKAESTIPDDWKRCETKEDCRYVRNDKNCETVSVNKEFFRQAAEILTKNDSDNRVMSLDAKTIRCVNQPESFCQNNICKLMVHPE